ncbi:MAG: carboxylesterase/lipase family protein [Acidimicrobiaceae bacterium]|nr:carboxylesterase/lipase family protein [Acidimicrobiaceae bacterium]
MAVEVTISSGRLAGVDDQGVHAYKGIPYAAPPVGDLRWRPPVAPASWDGVRNASSYGPVALQQPMPGIFGELGTPPNPAGDDCLRLNVWTPDPGAGGMPVLVWIHGGAFYAGSGVDDVYNGAAFARDGVVCVTINYRLGVQGYMNLASHFGHLPASGNIGMLDQVAALQWVQENIAAFGGDPSKVTIAGESAGGMSCGTLMAMPAAKGLFQGAIPQSGAAHNGLSADTASLISGYVLDAVGVKPGDTDALAAVSNDALLAAQIDVVDDLGATRNPEKYREAAASAMAFQPTYFTEELPQRPIDAIAAGAASDVRVLIGSTMEEAQIFVVDLKEMFNEELVRASVGAVFGMVGKDGDAALGVYSGNRPEAAPHELAAAVETDRMFTVPAVRLADAQAAHNPDLWMYRFDWRTPQGDGEWGAHHFLEVPFMFDQIDNDMARGFVGDDPPLDLVANTHEAWVRFVTDGDPNHTGLPDWPRWTTQSRPTMLLDTECRVANRPADDEISLWDGVI